MEATKHTNIFDAMSPEEKQNQACDNGTCYHTFSECPANRGDEAKNLGSVSTERASETADSHTGQSPPRIWLHKADEGDSWACAVWSETSSSASAENVPYVPEASYDNLARAVELLIASHIDRDDDCEAMRRVRKALGDK